MGATTERTVKRLFALSGNRCAYPGCEIIIVPSIDDVVLGDICHIRAKSKTGPRFDEKMTAEERDGFDNLILLCKNHHAIVDQSWKTYTAEVLLRYKKRHETNGSPELGLDDAKRAMLLFQSYLTISAKKVSLRIPAATKLEATRESHPDSVAADLDMVRYIKGLIKHYQECQKWDKSKDGRGKYVTIYNAIKREFGSAWQDVPKAQFDRLTGFLQRRISGTKLGLVTPHNLFSSFEEYLRKYKRSSGDGSD